MKRILIFIIGLLCSFSMFGQGFPESWTGTYQGKLEMLGIDSVSMVIDMKLTIVKKKDSIYIEPHIILGCDWDY